jgi:hypothetical protein
MLRDLHLFDLLTQGSTITLYVRITLSYRAKSNRRSVLKLTVPYFPVIPTFFVRFVCGHSSVHIFREAKALDSDHLEEWGLEVSAGLVVTIIWFGA